MQVIPASVVPKRVYVQCLLSTIRCRFGRSMYY